MSYSILYRSCYIKLSDGTYVPVDEVGDNNVWDADNRKRSREWSTNWNMFHDRLSYSREEILVRVRNIIAKVVDTRVGKKESWEDHAYTRDELLSNFGYFESVSVYGKSCNATSAKMFENHFLKGIELAKTMNELVNLGITVSVSNGYYSDGFRAYCNTEEELLKAYNEAVKTGKEVYVGYPMGIGDYTWKHEICRTQPAKPKPLQTEGYVVNCGTNKEYYVQKKTPRRWHFATSYGWAFKYASLTTARKIVEMLSRQKDSMCANPTIVPVKLVDNK